MKDLILGTAGHIDHGKTSLIGALTGVNTDRLPEEKKRGITIELGFAELTVGDFRLGIVDVPGHERFVRNMLAGATGIDLAMLVVAADDSVKPQTREHLEILRLLGVRQGVIALTKCDLTDPDWIGLVEEEVRDLVSETGLRDARIVRTSSHTGAGIDELRDALQAAADQAWSTTQVETGQPFRMAIDRTFSIAGHGTVVTGSISSGQVSVGDELMIEPGGTPVRVRGLQNHDRQAESAHRGQRAAINLAGIRVDEIGMGHELSTPGHLVPGRVLTVWLELLKSGGRTLKNRARVRLHVGTAELFCSVVLLGKDRLEAGESGPAQLFLSQPAVSTWNQPLVIRSESPVETIGGGHLLDPTALKLRRPGEDVLKLVSDLRSDDPVERASAALYFNQLRTWRPEDLSRSAGVKNIDEVVARLRERGDLIEIPISPTRQVCLHSLLVGQVCERVEATLTKMHEAEPLRTAFDRVKLASGFRYLGEPVLFNAILETMSREKRIRLTDRNVGLAGHGPKLSKNETRLLASLIERFRAAGIESPTIKQCQQQAANNQQSVPQLIELAAANGDLVSVTSDYYLHAEVDDELKQTLDDRLSESETGMTLSEIREALNTSRKYAIPYCEYLDRIGFTRRDGDVRRRAAGTE